MYTTNYSYHREETSTLKRWRTAIVKAIVRYGKDFCDRTSMHGFSHITASRRHWFERLLWIVATGFAIWCALDVSLGQLQRFNDNPTVVTLEKDFRSWRYSLPAATVCYDNRLDKTKLPAVIKNYFNVEPSDEKYEYYTRFVNAVVNSDLLNLEKFEEFQDLDEKVDMFQIAVDVMPEAQVKTMSSEGSNYKWVAVMTEAGACYVTNSVAHIDTAIMKIPPNETAMAPVTCKYSSLSCYIMMDVTAPARVYIHSPYNIMEITLAPSVVFLTLTRITEMSIMETRCGRGVKELQPSRRGCLYNDEPTSAGRKVYSTNTCRLSCRSKLAMKLCGCIPFYYFYAEDPQCTPAGMWCLAKHATQLASNNGEKCNCAPQCIDSVYREISTSDQTWEKVPFNTRGSVKFTVQPPRTRYTREIVFHFQDLVVSFGGAAGLFLGASFLSFVEIIYFVLARFFGLIRKEKGDGNRIATARLPVTQEAPEMLRIKELTKILENQRYYPEIDYRTRLYC